MENSADCKIRPTRNRFDQRIVEPLVLKDRYNHRESYPSADHLFAMVWHDTGAHVDRQIEMLRRGSMPKRE